MKCQLAVVIMVCVMAQRAMAEGHLDGAYLRDVTESFVTPHLRWGKPLAGGPVKSLFVVPRRIAAREVVELAQRLELDYQAVATANALTLGADNAYDAAVQGTSTYEKAQELLDKLAGSYEVIVLANFDLHALPAEAQFKLLRKVADGAGLLIVYTRPIRYKKLFDRPTEDWRSVLALVSATGLPQPLQGVRNEKLLQTYGFGKGRIALLSYPGVASVSDGGLGFTVNEEYSPQWRAHYENNLALVGRSLLWAAGRAAPFAMRLDATGDLAADELTDQGLAVSFQNDDPAADRVSVRLRDEWNVVRWKDDVAIQRGPSKLKLKLPPLPAGAYCLDAVAEAEGKAVGFGYQAFTVRSAVGKLTLETDKSTYERGQPVRCTLTLERPVPFELSVRARLEDSPYRQVWAKCRATIGAGERQVTFELPSGMVPTIASAVVCEVSAGADKPIGQVQQFVFLPQRSIEMFPTILWNSVPEELSEMYARAVAEGTGWRAGLSHPTAHGSNARTAALFDQRFIPYTTRIGLKNDEDGRTVTAQWLGLDKKEIEAAGIEKDGSFYNPKVQSLWKESIRKRMDGLPAYGPMLYNLGDENHFSYDAGYSPSDEKAYRQYLKQRYGQIDRLNQEWQTSYSDFDSVEHLSPKELRNRGAFAQWYDHRRYMEQQYADVHHFLADCIRAIDPHAKVGAEGSVPGNLELTMSKLDFWGPYSDPVMDELQRSIDASKLHTSWWGGFVGGIGGRDSYPWPLWRQLLQGVVNGSAWYSSAIDCFGFLGIDFSQADYFNQMRPRLEALENGQAQLLISQPLKRDGIAILWSHASASASMMDERFFKPTDSTNAFIQFCYRQGLNFDFLTSSMLEAGKLDGYRVLLLCGASALSERETQQIISFAHRGGLVIADLKPGVLNDYCRPLASSSLGDLFGTPAVTWESQPVLKPVNVDLKIRGRSLRFAAQKAWQSPEIPSSIAQETQKGAAILLNFNLGSAVNTASSQVSLDAFLLEMLGLARVAPSIQASGPAAEHLLLRVRQSADYTTIGTLVTKGGAGKSLTIALDQPAYVYEVGKGPMGRQETITTTVDEPFRLLCLFPQEPSAPALRLDRTHVSVGQPVRVDLSGLPADGVYRLQLIDPHGNDMRGRGRILTDLERGEPVDLHFAYSDSPGTYQAKLTDIRTTLTSVVEIQVDAEPR